MNKIHRIRRYAALREVYASEEIVAYYPNPDDPQYRPAAFRDDVAKADQRFRTILLADHQPDRTIEWRNRR